MTGHLTIVGGAVFQRGIYRSPDECERLLAVYRDQAEQSDWWAPFARELADELERAMRTANSIAQEAA